MIYIHYKDAILMALHVGQAGCHMLADASAHISHGILACNRQFSGPIFSLYAVRATALGLLHAASLQLLIRHRASPTLDLMSGLGLSQKRL
jgi:hypothetical protein